MFCQDGFVHLYDASLARKISEETAFQETPEQRSVGNKHPPLNTIADYVLLAIARQLVLHMPDHVCHIHSFSELYGGRIITDIIPEKQHVEFHGVHREVDHTKLEEKPMRLHVDDADHLLRAPIQLLLGIKNAACQHQVPPVRRSVDIQSVSVALFISLYTYRQL